LYDEAFVKQFTDLPLLVRMDTLKELRARDIFPDYKPAPLHNATRVLRPGEPTPPPAEQDAQLVPQALREEWDDFVVWDLRTSSPKAVSRDQVGRHFAAAGLDPALEGEFEVTLRDGQRVRVRPVFDLLKQYLLDTWTPENTSRITGAPVEAVVNLARQVAQNKTKTLFVMGMGPNHFFNDGPEGPGHHPGGRPHQQHRPLRGDGGQLRGQLPPRAAARHRAVRQRGPLPPGAGPRPSRPHPGVLVGRVGPLLQLRRPPPAGGNRQFTGKTHMPTPTKSAMWANSNSILGNAKWAHNVIVNTLPKIEMLVVADWFWTATCEYADVVFGVDSWAERKLPDVYAAVTNPFLQAWPPSPLARIFDTRDDLECWAGVAAKLAELTGDRRFRDYWHFVLEGKPEVYIDRAFRAGNTTRGYTFRSFWTAAGTAPPCTC
jgi:nitrate reductase / nitrite oxidoreductase, alpha subunit